MMIHTAHPKSMKVGDRVIKRFGGECTVDAKLARIVEIHSSTWITIQYEEWPFITQTVIVSSCIVVPPKLSWIDRLLGRTYTY